MCEMSDSEDDGVPQLSSHALAALQEFYAEQRQHADPAGAEKYNIGVIEENWQLSQFWYDQETARRLAEEARAAAGEGGRSPLPGGKLWSPPLPSPRGGGAPVSMNPYTCGGAVYTLLNLTVLERTDYKVFHCNRIACVSAPSVYQKLRELQGEAASSVCIFEYDRRFAVYGEEFIFYDYRNPMDLPKKVAAHSFDVVIADPPYLSEECLRKTAETIKYLTQGKILLCTGAVMEEVAAKLLGVKMCKFIPKHTRTLANEFRCYVNYDSGLDREL